MTQPIPMHTSMVAIIDILGFKELIRNTPLFDINNLYALLLTGASCASDVVKTPLEFMVYSDTIAIRQNNETEKGFIEFIKVISMMLYNYFYTLQFNPISLPLRGAISFGEYTWHKGDITTQAMGREPITAKNVNFILGKAIIDAHDHECSQEWIGISIESRSAEIMKQRYPCAFTMLQLTGNLVEYEVPIKNGLRKRGYSIAPNDIHFYEKIFPIYVDHVARIVTTNNMDIRAQLKHRNTIEFLNYIYTNGIYMRSYPAEFQENYKVKTLDSRFERQIKSILEHEYKT